LRARSSDIPLLVRFYASKFSKKFGKRLEDVSQRTMERLTKYGWPGNVRELEHVIERAAILSQGPMLQIDESLLNTQTSQPTPAGTLEEVEKAYILQVLRETDCVVEGDQGAAVRVDLHPNTLRSRMQNLGIKKPRRTS
jgi:DNA-binding NtrC family response regulator